MPYSLVSAATLGFDLVRLPAQPSTKSMLEPPRGPAPLRRWIQTLDTRIVEPDASRPLFVPASGQHGHGPARFHEPNGQARGSRFRRPQEWPEGACYDHKPRFAHAALPGLEPRRGKGVLEQHGNG